MELSGKIEKNNFGYDNNHKNCKDMLYVYYCRDSNFYEIGNILDISHGDYIVETYEDSDYEFALQSCKAKNNPQNLIKEDKILKENEKYLKRMIEKGNKKK